MNLTRLIIFTFFRYENTVQYSTVQEYTNAKNKFFIIYVYIYIDCNFAKLPVCERQYTYIIIKVKVRTIFQE